MRACHFVGAALHTHVADTLASHLDGLTQALNRVDQAAIRFAGASQTLRYKLLHGEPADRSAAHTRRVLFATIAAALQTANLTSQQLHRCGLFIGSSSFDIADIESDYQHEIATRPDAMAMRTSSSQAALAETVRLKFDIRGPDCCFNTACTASANALSAADTMIRMGEIDHAIVIGIETLNAITALGFLGLQLLTPTHMRPFSPDRNGLVLGEGCAVAVLGHERNADSVINPDWHLISSANLCDTHSMSAANPDGSTIAAVMESALQRAGVQPDELAAIKVHGTASFLNDEAEAAGLRRAFPSLPPLIALKPYLGHTLGACGLVELLLFCAAVDRNVLIGTPGIGANDESLGISLLQQTAPIGHGNFLLNYFGFGGNNTSLLMSNAPVPT